jgi:hypothetical protein
MDPEDYHKDLSKVLDPELIEWLMRDGVFDELPQRRAEVVLLYGAYFEQNREQAKRFIEKAPKRGVTKAVAEVLGVSPETVRGRAIKEYEETAASTELLGTVAGQLRAFAEVSGNEHTLHLRAAQHEGAVYLYLGPVRVVRCDAEGWRLDPNPPVMFRRVANLKELPDPERGGSLDLLDAFVTAQEERGDTLPRRSNADVEEETRRNLRRVSSLRVRDPDGSATTRGPSSGTGPFDD